MENTKKEEIERWYDEHSDALLKFILMLVKDYQQAEDLTHETFRSIKPILRRSSAHFSSVR
ncbi:hypothetical protein [Priestia aryabhattai]|uniref:hypothetical protein n=1 Tax=Priestia aryabhattai TaxID=412384 RepID=UPI003D2A28BD